MLLTHDPDDPLVPYSQTVDLDVGYHIIDPLFVNLGFSNLSRRVELQGDTDGTLYGTLSDNQLGFRLSVGYAL